ncbi:MAG: hypothetical protein AAFO76_01835 [Cyanobacteria bacterium J06607_15]
MNWIKEAGIKLPDAPEGEEIPEITEIDELQTFIGNKKNKVWVWSGRECAQCQAAGSASVCFADQNTECSRWSDATHRVNHWQPGILLWTIGDRRSSSFQILALVILSMTYKMFLLVAFSSKL